MGGAPQRAAQEAAYFVTKVMQIILVPIIALMMGVALLIFIWGAIEYIMNAADEKGRDTGRKHMFWGIIGLVVMVSALAIIQIAAATFGLTPLLNCARTPGGADCSQFFQVY